jgi:hypothetical protein
MDMSIRTLQFPEPFYRIKAIHGEKELKIANNSIVVNLSEKNIWVKDKSLAFLKSTIVRNITIKDVQRALVIEDYEKNDTNREWFDEIKKQWRLMYDMSKQERHKGILLWRSPKEKVDNIDLNLCYISADVDTGPHKEHSSNFMEVHTQLLGYGKMQKLEENDIHTMYQEVILSPGYTHEPFFNEDNVYPWHQYHSISDAIYMPIEIAR